MNFVSRFIVLIESRRLHKAAVATVTAISMLLSGFGLTAAHAAPGGKHKRDKVARDLGDEVVLITQAADGSLGNDVYSVAGVFRTGLDLLDGGVAILDLAIAQQLLALAPDQVHEIDRKSTRLNSSHMSESRMPSSA